MHDSHVHLNLNPLNKNIPEVIDNFISKNGKHILTQSTDLIDIEETLAIAQQYPEIIDVALGLHPTCFEEYTVQKNNSNKIYEYSQKYLQNWEEKFRKNISKVKAIGETGLDYFQFKINQAVEKDLIEELKEVQKLSFSKHIALSLEYNLPLSIHARDIQGYSNSVQDVLRLIANEGKGRVKGSFHSYTGDIKYVEDILSLDFYIGFNAIITYKSGENVREILRQTPLDRILFETDGPFLPPQSVRKDKDIKEKFAQPADVTEIMKVAAEVKNISVEKLESITDDNYEKLFA